MRPVYIVSAYRSAIGKFGGALSTTSPGQLGTSVCSALIERSKFDGILQCVDEVIIGNVLGAGHGMNLARQVALNSGLADSTCAFTINQVCGSGLKAVTLAAQSIGCGEANVIVAGGLESMSQAGFISLNTRWGAKLGHADLRDLILQDGLTDVFHSCHMGITAENLASKYKISREEQDQFAFDSQIKANKAIAAGKFDSEIVPIGLGTKSKPKGEFSVDEFPRADISLDGLAKLRPAFKHDGTVTAGNASGINDGAALLMLASEEALSRYKLHPLAQVVNWASAGVDPEIMGIGPVSAVRRLVEKSKLNLGDIRVIESNEAFAAQSIAVNRELGWDVGRVNPNGGAIALGHPIGASGARILVTLIHELRRGGEELGLATLCVGGGQGIAILVKSMQ